MDVSHILVVCVVCVVWCVCCMWWVRGVWWCVHMLVSPFLLNTTTNIIHHCVAHDVYLYLNVVPSNGMVLGNGCGVWCMVWWVCVGACGWVIYKICIYIAIHAHNSMYGVCVHVFEWVWGWVEMEGNDDVLAMEWCVWLCVWYIYISYIDFFFLIQYKIQIMCV